MNFAELKSHFVTACFKGFAILGVIMVPYVYGAIGGFPVTLLNSMI